MTRFLKDNKEDAFFLLAALAFASLLLALYSFAHPLTRAVPDDIPYQHAGTFSYSAAAPPGVYDTTTVQTGQPVFPRLTSLVTVKFDYRFESGLPALLAGTYRLVAEVSHPNGWKRTIELQPTTAFNGSEVIGKISGIVDLNQILALTGALERQTGLPSQPYMLAVVPEINVQGVVAGQKILQGKFAPRLEFRLDELQLQMLTSDNTLSGQNPLLPTQPGQITRFRTEPETLSLLNLSLAVDTARWISITGLVFAVGGMLALGAILTSARSREANAPQANAAPPHAASSLPGTPGSNDAYRSESAAKAADGQPLPGRDTELLDERPERSSESERDQS